MSYILDALRRADSERERGAIPGLHTRPVALGSSSGFESRDARRWLWIGVGVLVAAAGTMAWNLAAGPASPDAAQLAAASGAMAETGAPAGRSAPPGAGANPTQAPLDAATALARAPLPAAPPPTAALTAARTVAPTVAATAPTTRAPASATQPTPRAVQERTAPLPAGREPVAVMPAQRSAAVAAAPARSPAAAPAPRSPASPGTGSNAGNAGEGSTRIHTIDELPENVRRELPRLAIGGSMYSENAANRMLIVNGELLQEGARPAPDLVLEQIKPRGAVLKYKGYRYEMAY